MMKLWFRKKMRGKEKIIMKRTIQKAIIDNEVIEFDFIVGDLIQNKSDGTQGIITEIDSPFVYIKWADEEVRKKRGTKWLVRSIERVYTDFV